MGDLETERTAALAAVEAVPAVPFDVAVDVAAAPTKGRRSAETLVRRGVLPLVRGGRIGLGETVTGVCGPRVLVSAGYGNDDLCVCVCGGCCCSDDAGSGGCSAGAFRREAASRAGGGRAAVEGAVPAPLPSPIGDLSGEDWKEVEELAVNTRCVAMTALCTEGAEEAEADGNRGSAVQNDDLSFMLD